MATNGESAKKWLADNQQKISEPRVKQIRDSLEKKVNDLSNTDQDDLDDEYQGVLEALEVMDAFIRENYHPIPVPEENNIDLDSSSLTSDAPANAPVLNHQEKQARFQALLKDSKY